MAMATGWRASSSIQGDGKGSGGAMARPTPTTTFDVRGGGVNDRHRCGRRE
jgi:hypothetical protein